MKRLLVFAVLLATGAATVVAGGAVARGQANQIRTATTLTAGEEVPGPKGEVSAARGAFAATIRKSGTGASISWTLTFSGLTGAAGAAHIHTAPRGDPGPVSVPLCGPCESRATGTANIDATVLDAIQSGRAYVNVHTRTNGAGEIRGQLAVTASAKTALNTRQERPRPKGRTGRARGSFSVAATRSGGSAVIAWRLSFSRLTGRATAAHIHIGRRGVAGPVAVPLCGPCRSGARGRATVSGATLAALEAGRAYVNVHTARNPGG